MKKQQKHLILTLFAAGILFLSACTGTNPTPAGGMTEGTQTGSMPSTGGEGEIDMRYIDMMVPHHQGAVEMAKIALERSQRPEIQEMANAIIASQEEEIGMMIGWKQAWYGSSDTPPMSAMPMMEAMEGMGGMGHPMNMQAEVDALRSAPEPFDLAFIDAMIPHHQSAIDAGQMVLETATHSEIREMAQQVIDEQQKEIDQMKAWRTEWYPDAPALK
jgi:uncharacterized protein (DUF305 family)